MRRVIYFLLLLSVLLPGCSSDPGVGAPVEVSLENTEGAVADHLKTMLARAQADPGASRARAELGMAYEVSGRLQAAHESYAQAALLDPEEPRWHYLQAVTQAELGDLERALLVLERAIALNGNYAAAHLYRGSWLLDLGRVEEAGRAFTRATQLATREPAAWIGIVRVHLAADRPADALAILNSLLESSRDNAYLYQLAGQAYREQGDMEQARAMLARAKPSRPPSWSDPWRDERNDFEAGYGAGMINASNLMKQEKVAEATAVMEQLRQQRPGDRQLLNNLSVAYRNLRQPDRAFEVLRDGLERHPDYYPFHLNISADYQRKGDLDQALWHLRRVIEISPTFAPGWERIGGIYLSSGDLPEALEAYDSAARFAPSQPSFQLYCGVILGRLERWEESEARLQRALELNPNLSAVLIPLGRAQAEIGRFEDARASLLRAAGMAPDSQHLKQAQARLAELEAAQR